MAEYRRRLPHWQPDDTYIFLTWRLWGSLPARRSMIAYPTAGHAFVAMDRLLDRASSGPLWLNNPDVAGLVAEAIQAGDSERDFYGLCAWSVMANHVHMLIHPKVQVTVLMRWLKGSTSRKANQVLGRTGQPFWQDESYDHWVRDRGEWNRVVRYIERNPVSAGLVDSIELWRWSSAWAGESPAPH